MKIAFCLYGQPRNAREGHAVLQAFVDKHPHIQFDFYLHAWHDASLKIYDASPWRAIPESDLRVDADVAEFLLQAYRPVAHVFEPPKIFGVSALENSAMYANSPSTYQQNLQNTLSQLYSRQTVRNLVQQPYDLVVASRYDFRRPIDLNLHEIDQNKLHVANFHLPRVLFPDNFIVAPPRIFHDLFNAYDNLPIIINNPKILKPHGEPFVLTIENILLANFLTQHTLEKVVYTPRIPDFR